jgi:hypothetical protein
VAFGLALGAVEYLTKPVLSGDVLRQLSRMLEAPLGGPAAGIGAIVPQSR